MSRILITGGTGVLGRELRPRLLGAGEIVRVMSRRQPEPGEDKEVEWAQAQLADGEGLAEAVNGVHTIIHAASTPVGRQVDVDGTRLLLQEAKAAGVKHFVYISIVGVDQIPFAYYKNKLAAEQIIQDAGVPWTILRATQFHNLIDRLISAATRLPVALLPTDFQFQSISAGEVSEHLLQAVQGGPAGRLPDIGGPEVLQLGHMTQRWLEVTSKRRLVLRLPLPGQVAAGFRQGLNTVPENRAGQLTWNQWLAARYGNRDAATSSSRSDDAAGHRASS